MNLYTRPFINNIFILNQSIEIASLVCSFINQHSMRTQKISSNSSTGSSEESQTSSKSSRASRGSSSADAGQDDDFVIVAAPKRKEKKRGDTVTINKDLRIVEYDLVLATGLMPELKTVEIISRSCYFGRYGQIDKVIISSKHESFEVLNQDVQAFVTYKDEFDAAWAIAALRDYRHHYKRNVRVHFGTSRYCNRFIQGKECTLKNCYFNHHVRINHEHKDSLKNSVASQYDRVYELIEDNLQYFVEKEYKEFKNKSTLDEQVPCTCFRNQGNIAFPSNKEVMQRLISQGYIDEKEYEAVKAKIKLSNRAKVKNGSVQKQGKENVMQATPQKKADKKEEPVLVRQEVKGPEEKASPKKTIDASKHLELSAVPTQQVIVVKTLSKCLEEYIEKNIINEAKPSEASPQKAIAPLQSTTSLPLRKKKYRKLNPAKVGDLVLIPSCQFEDPNPETLINEYLITKIMDKALAFTLQKKSRFSFAPKLDFETQVAQERKIKAIIGNKLMNL